MNYQQEAQRTLSNEFFLDHSDLNMINILHGAIGICTEAGELLDSLKKAMFYGSELDRTNVIEELSDIEWYMAVMREALGVSQEEVQDLNIRKLKARYPEKWTKERALDRDLDNERRILENK